LSASSTSASMAFLVSILAFTSLAHAQSTLAPADRIDANTRGPTEAAASAAPGEVCNCAEQCAPSPPKKREPMNGWAIGFAVGFTQVNAGVVKNPAYSAALADLAQEASVTEADLVDAGLREGTCTPLDRRCRTEGRTGFQLSVPIQLGGSGVGFRFEPFLTLADTAQAYGAYLGPTFEFRVADPLYLGFGFGLKAAWINPKSDWRYAFDLHGRIPAHITWYVLDDLALVLEFAFGAGASAFGNRPHALKNPLTGRKLANPVPPVTFGLGRAFDVSIGIRFP
jgi:hypothetical protein